MRSLRLYNALVVVVGLLAAPVAGLICVFRPAWRRGLTSRLGFGWPASGAEEVLWAHAASVGEVEGIAPLIRRWRGAHPGGTVVLSALTATGCDTARRLLPEAQVRAFPLDVPWITRAVVRRLRPRLFLFSENEIWPNAIVALAREGVPIVQVSGRLSAGAARTLARFPGLAREVLGRVTRFCVQGEEHRRRLLDLGVLPGRVVVTGSLKGADRAPVVAPFVASLEALGRPIVVAGSTHAGEEVALLDALTRWRGPNGPYLVLAPRHPERFDQVAGLLDRRAVRYVRRSRLPDPGPRGDQVVASTTDVLLLDSMGELAGCYTVAGAAFLGGTLVAVGGHNPLEAARAGVPIVAGPHHENVRSILERLVAVGAAAIADGPESLAAALASFLDSSSRDRARSGARQVAGEEARGLEATWEAIDDLMGPSTTEESARVASVAAATAAGTARAG